MAKLKDMRGVLNGLWTVHSALHDDLNVIEGFCKLPEKEREAMREQFRFWFAHHVEMEGHHHGGENEYFFPKIEKYLNDNGDFVHDMTKRSQEAKLLAEQILEGLKQPIKGDELTKQMHAYVKSVEGRFRTEEAIFAPIILQYFTRESYMKIEQGYQKSMSLKTMRTFIPWSLTRLTPEERVNSKKSKFFPPGFWFMFEWFLEPSYKKKYGIPPIPREKIKETKGLEL